MLIQRRSSICSTQLLCEDPQRRQNMIRQAVNTRMSPSVISAHHRQAAPQSNHVQISFTSLWSRIRGFPPELMVDPEPLSKRPLDPCDRQQDRLIVRACALIHPVSSGCHVTTFCFGYPRIIANVCHTSSMPLL